MLKFSFCEIYLIKCTRISYCHINMNTLLRRYEASGLERVLGGSIPGNSRGFPIPVGTGQGRGKVYKTCGDRAGTGSTRSLRVFEGKTSQKHRKLGRGLGNPRKSPTLCSYSINRKRLDVPNEVLYNSLAQRTAKL